MQKPLYLDGIDQSLDPAGGNRWILLLNEVGGEGSGVITVKLYEAGNRSRAIAERDVPIGANQEVRLDTLFAELGLELPERSKARDERSLRGRGEEREDPGRRDGAGDRPCDGASQDARPRADRRPRPGELDAVDPGDEPAGTQTPRHSALNRGAFVVEGHGVQEG